MLKRVFVVALLGAALACAKTYRFTIRDAMVAGGAQLKPGEYALKLDNGTAELVDNKGTKIGATVRIEQGDAKSSRTAAIVRQTDAGKRLHAVELQGSKDRVVFD